MCSGQCCKQACRLTVLTEWVPQVVNGILDGALAGDPGLHGKAQGCQHAQSAVAHLHPHQHVHVKTELQAKKTPNAIIMSATQMMLWAV
jgi:hypothetical protein